MTDDPTPAFVYECRRCWQRADSLDNFPHNCTTYIIDRIEIPASRVEVIDPLFKPSTDP